MKNKVDPKDIYNYCKESDHWMKDCPKKAKKDSIATIGQNDSSSENDLVLVAGEQPQQHYEQWVLDLGYSYHICPHKI